MAEFELRVSNSANALDVTQIRDAAMASKFASREEIQTWLGRAFGPDVELLRHALAHARRAVELCPLQGEAYLHLADLLFMELGTREQASVYIDQGLRLRPYDRNVLAKAGAQALAMGRVDVAISYWRKCFNAPGRHQQEIIYRLVTAGMPANEFLACFQPDWRTLRQIWNQYRKSGRTEELGSILAYAMEQTNHENSLDSGMRPAHVWYAQSRLYADVGQKEASLECLERAYACDPRQYAIRRALAAALQSAGRVAEAEPHVRWCLARHPADKSLNAALVAISKARLAPRDASKTFDRRVNAASGTYRSDKPAQTQR
jgi:tetratricopeptide (TPR) repeat protein